MEIIYGDKEGNVELLYGKKSVKAHEGWIFEIKHENYEKVDYFFGLGAIDFQLSVIKYQNEKITLTHKINLGGYGRSISSFDDKLLIGKRDGAYEEFSIK